MILKLLRETASLSIVYINSFHIATICRSIINLQLLYGSRVIQAGDINIWKNISAPWKPMNIACFRTEIVIGIHFLIILQAKLHISYKSIAKADLLFLPAGPFMFNALFKISIIKYICYILKMAQTMSPLSTPFLILPRNSYSFFFCSIPGYLTFEKSL